MYSFLLQLKQVIVPLISPFIKPWYLINEQIKRILLYFKKNNPVEIICFKPERRFCIKKSTLLLVWEVKNAWRIEILPEIGNVTRFSGVEITVGDINEYTLIAYGRKGTKVTYTQKIHIEEFVSDNELLKVKVKEPLLIINNKNIEKALINSDNKIISLFENVSNLLIPIQEILDQTSSKILGLINPQNLILASEIKINSPEPHIKPSFFATIDRLEKQSLNFSESLEETVSKKHHAELKSEWITIVSEIQNEHPIYKHLINEVKIDINPIKP